MAITLGEALVYLTAKSEGFDQELGKAETKTRSWAGNIGGTVSAALGGAIVAGATVAAGAIVGIGVASFDMANQVTEATGRIQTQLGLTEEQAEAFGKTITDIYGHNFGESIDDVADSLATVEQAMDALYQPTAEQLGSLTEYALSLRDAFDVDVSESARAANQVMQQFGVSGEEAFEIIAAGMQNGLNSSDDFLDTLNEYAADFADLGFTADETLSFINSGIGAGIYNTDKLADAMREFKINLLDAGRLESIEGLSPELDKAAQAFANGEISGVEAFEAIRKALQGIDDPLKQQEAGVALFGSLWEDLGKDAILSLDTMSDSLLDNYDVLGSLNKQYENLGDVAEGLKRRALTAIAPIGDALLGLINDNMPLIEAGFEWFENQLPGIIEVGVAAISQIGKWIQDPILPLLAKFSRWWKEEAYPAIKPVADQIIAQLIPGFQQLGQWAGELGRVVLPILSDAIKWVIENFDIIGPILAITVAAILALTSPIGAVVIALTTLATAWANDWGGIQEKTAAVIEFFNEEILPHIEAFFAVFHEIFLAFKALFEGDWYAFGEHIRGAFENASQLIQGIMQTLGEVMLNLMSNAVNSILDFVRNTDWLQLGKDILGGIGQGITEGIPNLLEDGKNAIQDFVAGLKGEAEIESPSKFTKREVGIPLGQGVTEGFALSLEDLPDVMGYSLNSLGENVVWRGTNPLAEAQSIVDASLAADIKKNNEAKLKESMAAIDAANAARLAEENASIGEGISSSPVSITVYADSQTNGQQVGEDAAKAYTEYLSKKGGQT